MRPFIPQAGRSQIATVTAEDRRMHLEGIQGAVLSVSLRYLDEWTAARVRIGQRYHSEIRNDKFIFQAHPENTSPVFHLFEVQVPDPEHFLK